MPLDLFEVWNTNCFNTYISTTVPKPNLLPEGYSVEWVYDIHYETEGSYAYDTEEETKKAEQWELEKLAGGSLVALGCILKDETGETVDSLWGIVIEPETNKLFEFFHYHFVPPSPQAAARNTIDRCVEQLIKASTTLAKLEKE